MKWVLDVSELDILRMELVVKLFAMMEGVHWMVATGATPLFLERDCNRRQGICLGRNLENEAGGETIYTDKPELRVS